MQRTSRARTIALIVCLAAVTISSVIAALSAPIALAGGAAVILALVAVHRFGFTVSLIVVGILCTSASAFLGRYVDAAGVLNSIGTAMLIVAGIAGAPRARIDRRVALPASIFLIMATASALLTVPSGPEYAFRAWVAIVAGMATVIAVAGALAPREAPHPERFARARPAIFWTIILVVVANIALGLRQALFGLTPQETQSAIDGVSTYKVGDQIRLMGAFQSNQDMGLFLACMAPAFLVLALTTLGKSRKWFYILSALLYVVNFLSLTRTSLIAGVSVGLVALLIWGKGEVVLRVLRNVLFACAALALGALVLAALNVPRVQAAVDRALTLTDLSSDGSFNSRQNATLPIAFRAFTDNLLGLGVGSAGPVSQQFPTIAPYGYLIADNGYLNIAIQLGIIGILVFIWFLVASVLVLGRRGAPYPNAAAAAVLALCIAMLTAGYWSLLAPICLIAAFVGLGFSDHTARRVSAELSVNEFTTLRNRSGLNDAAQL